MNKNVSRWLVRTSYGTQLWHKPFAESARTILRSTFFNLFLYEIRDWISLNSLGTNCHILGPRLLNVSNPWFSVLGLEIHFQHSYYLEIYHSWSLGLCLYSPETFLLQKIANFDGEYWQNYRQNYLFQEFLINGCFVLINHRMKINYLLFNIPVMKHPHKSTVRKLLNEKCLH